MIDPCIEEYLIAGYDVLRSSTILLMDRIYVATDYDLVEEIGRAHV